jgi:hypothetical protein
MLRGIREERGDVPYQGSERITCPLVQVGARPRRMPTRQSKEAYLEGRGGMNFILQRGNNF